MNGTRPRRVLLALAIAALPLDAGAQARDSTDTARAATSTASTSTATTTTALPDSTPMAPAAAGAPGTSVVTWAALALGLVGTGLAALAFASARDISRRASKLQQQVGQLSQQRAQQASRAASSPSAAPRSPAAAPRATPPPQPQPQPIRPAGVDAGDLRARVEHLEMLVAQLRENAARTAFETEAFDADLPDEPSYTAFETAARPAPKPDVQVLPGVLSQGDEVRLTNSSRPMVHVHWAPSASTAEVWVNPDYKFADLTADYLTSAFEVDTRGPGSYETVSPAVIAWSSGASAGRVQVRGRVRAAGG